MAYIYLHLWQKKFVNTTLHGDKDTWANGVYVSSQPCFQACEPTELYTADKKEELKAGVIT